MMLQQVNLYLPEFRKRKHWLDADKMLLILVLAGAALGLLWGQGYWQLSRARDEVAVLEQQRRQVAEETAALRASYGAQGQDQDLQQAIAQLEEGLQAKEALLQFLEGRSLGNASGFSEYLADLSRYHQQGLSLSRVQLTGGGASVLLAGAVLDAELVPRYLSGLSQGRSFAGKDFETLQIRGLAADLEGGLPPSWNFEVRTLEE